MAGPDPAIHAFLSETMGAMAKSPCRRNSSPSPSRSAASGVWCNKPLQRYRQQTKTNHLTRSGMGFNPLTPSLRGDVGFDLPAPSWRGGAADEAIHLSLRRKKMNCHAVSHDVVGESKPMPAGITRNLRSGVCQSLARLVMISTLFNQGQFGMVLTPLPVKSISFKLARLSICGNLVRSPV